MNRLSTEERSRVIACLVEGNSQRATVRMTNVARATVAKLAVEIGEACERFADNIMRDLPCTQIQCDEIWSFCYAKAKNVPQHLKGSGAGDVWTWVAIDPETKLIPAWYVGDRTAQSAYPFMRSVQRRLKNRVKLSTDGHRAYLIAVKAAFHLQEVDFGMLRKIYGVTSVQEVNETTFEVLSLLNHIKSGKRDPRVVETLADEILRQLEGKTIKYAADHDVVAKAAKITRDSQGCEIF